jgi:23S rRNA (cytosine1962-C5)-methyltransferase
MSDSYPSLILSSSAKKRRSRCHPWIFSNEIENPPHLAPGSLVTIHYSEGAECWTGYYNPHSLIAVRVLAQGQTIIDETWIDKKMESAWRYRQSLALPREAYRLIHGEADGLPGLIVDGYGKVCVIQSLTAGMDHLLEGVLSALKKRLHPDSILVRCDHEVRHLEGLASWKKTVWGEVPSRITVRCHGLQLSCDLLEGQKTGLYLDQMENNQRLAHFARDQVCLDLCCHLGSAGLMMAQAGAGSVLGIDASGAALALAAENAGLNKLDNIRFVVGDIFDFLKELCQHGDRYGVINLDPPPFAKRKKDVESALRGYRELNRRAFRLLREGGILCTSTCSHHIQRDLFLEMLILAARDSGRQARLIEVRGQAADHPPLLSAPETNYLTCVLMQVE